jgi:hypothetical protein
MPKPAKGELTRTKQDRVTTFLERETFLPILFAMVGGAASAIGLTWLTAFACTDSGIPFCEVVTKNPPWLFVTTVAAVPSAILTWTWRTRQAKATLALSRSGDVTSRYSAAVELLDKGGFAALGGIYALERLAKDSASDHWFVMETLAAFVREPLAREDERERRALVQAAMVAIGGRQAQNDPAGERLDLSRSNLKEVTLRKGNFERVLFTAAKMQSVHANGANLRGADFSGADVNLLSFDQTTLLDQKWRDVFEHMGALDETPVHDSQDNGND